MGSRVLEICVDNIVSAQNAQIGGANRIELCQALEVGGVTPSKGLIKTARKLLTIPIFLLVRPRSGDFCYNNEELSLMKEDIQTGLAFGVDGFVTGALNKKGEIDREACSKLLAAANGLPVTFHRAYDVMLDDHAVMDIIDLGFSRILTSGRAPTAFQGKDTIKQLIDMVSSKIIIMPGSGVSDKNLQELLTYTNASEYHSSAQLYKEEKPDEIVKGTTFFPVADVSIVKAMRKILNSVEL